MLFLNKIFEGSEKMGKQESNQVIILFVKTGFKIQVFGLELVI
jgi:hypothetical protein